MEIHNIELELFGGMLSLIYVLICFMIGGKLFSKYFEGKQKIMVYAGITLSSFSIPWLASSLSLLGFLINGYVLPNTLYLLIASVPTPLIPIAWTLTMCNLLEFKREKEILITICIVSAVFEIYIITATIIDISLIGEVTSIVNSEFQLPVLLYLLGVLSYLSGTGVLVAIRTNKVEKRATRLRGRFLAIGFLLALVSGLLDGGLVKINPIGILLVRIGLVLSALFFYLSFSLPQRLLDYLSK
jgi:hypothetical protein